MGISHHQPRNVHARRHRRRERHVRRQGGWHAYVEAAQLIGDAIDTMADIETFSRVAGQESITFVVSDEIAHSEDPKSAITGCSNLMNEINEYVTCDPRLIETSTRTPSRAASVPVSTLNEERTGLVR